MNILHIHESHKPGGGGEVYLRDICEAQSDRGHEVAAVYTSFASTDYHPQPWEFFIEPSTGIKAGLKTKTRSLHLIKDLAPDIIHLHGVHGVSPYILRTIIREWPTVYTLHEILWLCLKSFQGQPLCRICTEESYFRSIVKHSDLRSIPYNLVRLWVLHELKQVSTCLIHSEGVKQAIIRNGFPSDRIEALRPYLPLPDTWITNPPLGGIGGCVDPPLREAGAYAELNNVILFVGKLASHKGIFDLVEAVSRIHNVTWKLVVIGDGERIGDVRELLLDKGLLEKSAIQGRISREKLGEYYRNASVVVVPSRCPETFGFIGPEAMFFGKPVVAYDSGIQNEWLIDGETGYCVRCRDIAGLSEKIQLLLTDKDLAKKFGENGKKRCSMFLDKQRHINKLIEIYERSIQLYRLNS